VLASGRSGVLLPLRRSYQHTPDWEYFDLHKNAPFTGLGQLELSGRDAGGSSRGLGR